jgi:hypothetical protein
MVNAAVSGRGGDERLTCASEPWLARCSHSNVRNQKRDSRSREIGLGNRERPKHHQGTGGKASATGRRRTFSDDAKRRIWRRPVTLDRHSRPLRAITKSSEDRRSGGVRLWAGMGTVGEGGRFLPMKIAESSSQARRLVTRRVTAAFFAIDCERALEAGAPRSPHLYRIPKGASDVTIATPIWDSLDFIDSQPFPGPM